MNYELLVGEVENVGIEENVVQKGEARVRESYVSSKTESVSLWASSGDLGK